MSTNVNKLEAGRVPPQGATKGLRIAAWATTGLFAATMTLSGVMYLIGPEPVVRGMAELGYPVYFARLLGVAKVLGAAGLLIPGRPKLWEWAYAGFTFDLLGAVVSHAATGGTAHIPQPLIALGLMTASYFLRRRMEANAAGDPQGVRGSMS